ncbi:MULTISPECIES: polysaccharide biosynthesis/export family protein [Proteiniphilum]|uniref:polysaccharide biosynthesis/export family protein n=1 Tax=Proteiniphilum TaxID=294702 RepID=UPI0028ACBA2F|nr:MULTISPECIES: polysaccharide biosynthesis/export family protein [Proteiniphilum]MDY9918303.1 polysaccharide biosynthesis/export family protein [Proteiniphilum sp.]
MRKIIYLLVFACITVSCTQVKDIAYFQQTDQGQTVLNSEKYDAQIKPKDMLSITVVSSEPAAASRYNLVMPQVDARSSSILTQPALQSYLVDNDGTINFPSLGKLKVGGLTAKQLEEHIGKQLEPYFIEEMPVITVRFLNYTVNVLGEVQRPGKFETTNGRMTIFEGLAMAGDMTIYGKRDNVKVLRENENGEKVIYTLNLNNKKVFDSPAFFLEQNDIVYVEPNQTRANSSRYGAAENFRISTLSILISVATLGVSLFSVLSRPR